MGKLVEFCYTCPCVDNFRKECYISTDPEFQWANGKYCWIRNNWDRRDEKAEAPREENYTTRRHFLQNLLRHPVINQGGEGNVFARH